MIEAAPATSLLSAVPLPLIYSPLKNMAQQTIAISTGRLSDRQICQACRAVPERTFLILTRDRLHWPQGNTPVKSISELLFTQPGFKEQEHWVSRSYPANKVVITEGECGNELFVVMQGTVRVAGNIELECGSTIHPGICDLGAGAIFGEFGVLTHNLRTATVTTVTDCELAVIDANRLHSFFETHSRIGYR